MTAQGALNSDVRLIALPERVVSRQLIALAEHDPDARFALVGAGAWLTAGALLERARRAAGGFRRLGVGRGDPVAIMLGNREEYLVAWFALSLLGAVEVPVNTYLKGTLLHHVLHDSRAEVLVTEAGLVREVERLEHPLADLRTVLSIPSQAWEELCAGPPADPEPLTAADPAAVMYTSGTTGEAKGVVCPHGYLMCWADDTARAVRLGPGDVLYTPLPLYHITGQAVNVLAAMLARARVVVDSRFSPRGFWSRMAELETTHVWSFGSMTPLLFREPAAAADREHRVRVVWSIPWPAGYGAEFEERFGVRILGGYGSTEQGLTLYQPYDGARPDAVGRPGPYYEVRIVDEAGTPVAPGEVGELVTRPVEPASAMTEYLRRPEDTVAAYRDLWYHTGDRAHEVGDGFIRFVDRKRDAIRRRGENISAWEIEAVAESHPAVSECAAVGIPSDLGEEEVMLVAVASGALTAEELFAFCREHLAYFMVPRYIELTDALPKTPSLRVQKFLLREQGVGPRTWDCEQAGIRIRRPEVSV